MLLWLINPLSMLLQSAGGSSTESTDHSHQNNLDDTCKRKLNPDESKACKFLICFKSF